jgi:hypothetical protein
MLAGSLLEANGLALEMLQVFVAGKVLDILKRDHIGLGAHLRPTFGQAEVLVFYHILDDLPDGAGISEIFIAVIIQKPEIAC